MARFITVIISVFMLSKCLFATALPQCSTDGIRGLAGCECNFVGACDIHGTHIPGLNIADHLPRGLNLYGYRQSVLIDRNLAYLCEGETVAILFDCNNRIPLYAATVITGTQLNAPDRGGRPQGVAGTFRQDRSKLPDNFQQSDDDYAQALNRKICYKKRGSSQEIIDNDWYKAKNLNALSSVNVGCGSRFLREVQATIHRGHLIASQYGIGDQRKKEATFVYTNAVPQFGVFNSIPWNHCERKLIKWGRDNCAFQATQSVRMFIVVVAIPSTFFGSSETRYFGQSGFSDYQDAKFRGNVPKEMWTAACCTFQYKDDGRAGTKSTAFWRENVPVKHPCEGLKVNEMEERLKRKEITEINLFPFHGQCRDESNYVSLP